MATSRDARPFAMKILLKFVFSGCLVKLDIFGEKLE